MALILSVQTFPTLLCYFSVLIWMRNRLLLYRRGACKYAYTCDNSYNRDLPELALAGTWVVGYKVMEDLYLDSSAENILCSLIGSTCEPYSCMVWKSSQLHHITPIFRCNWAKVIDQTEFSYYPEFKHEIIPHISSPKIIFMNRSGGDYHARRPYTLG